jgi:nicotinate-nucleotide pyrophosphorylase (carboxylating)
MKNQEIDAIITAALNEDMPDGDITSDNVIPQEATSEAVLMVKEPGILAGLPVAERVFSMLDPKIRFKAFFQDGNVLAQGDKLAAVQGNSIAMLKGERTALNFLQRMSGIATLTQQYVKALQGTQARLLDTRKTTPGLRILEKYAVKIGGGTNHRQNLSDMVMLKDNHLRLVGSIREAVQLAKSRVDPSIRIEVETTSLEQVKDAVRSGADIIMLDNMTIEEIQAAVRWVKGRVPLEVSGNVDLERIRAIAVLGVDTISVGRLTHSYRSLDICMEFL